MTVEWAVAFPVFIVVAVVTVNAFLFFADCAEFDRVVRNAVRVHVASPAYGQDMGRSQALVQGELDDAFGEADNLEVEALLEGGPSDSVRCTATLRFAPTLFGMGMRSSVFGVPLPRLEHRTWLAVDVYKPGVLF